RRFSSQAKPCELVDLFRPAHRYRRPARRSGRVSYAPRSATRTTNSLGQDAGRTGERLMRKLAPLVLAALLMPAPAFAAKYFMYVGAYTAGTSKGIYAWSLDSSSGKLESLGLVAETPQAAHVWIAPNGKTLYTVNWETQGGVSAYHI